jgi:hypothetical protein
MVTMMIVGCNGCKDDPHFCKSYSVKEERELVQSVQLWMDKHNVSACQACLLIGVNQMYYTQFKRVIKKIDGIKHRDVFVLYETNGSARKVHLK